MTNKLSYLYPITRVQSVEQLLRTTVHSAFPIVTPVAVGTIPERPANVSDKHTPQLYSRMSYLGLETDPESDALEGKLRQAPCEQLCMNSCVELVPDIVLFKWRWFCLHYSLFTFTLPLEKPL